MRNTKHLKLFLVISMWSSLSSFSSFSSFSHGEELKKPDFVLPETLIKGQLEQTVGLSRGSLLLPSPLSGMQFKEAPVIFSEDMLGARVKSLPGARPSELDQRLSPPLMGTHQDRMEEWWAGTGLFSQWWLKGLLAREWEKGRYLMKIDHTREDGPVARNAKTRTDGLIDVEFMPDRRGVIGVMAEVTHAWTELPTPASFPLTEWERWGTRGALTAGYEFSPAWRGDVTAGWRTIRYVKEATEDVLVQAKLSTDFYVEGMADHRWFVSTALRQDALFGTVGSLWVEDRIRDGAWTWHVGGRMDGSTVSGLARAFYTVAPQTTVFLKYEPRQDFPIAAELGFHPYAERPIGLRPVRVSFALTAGFEAAVSSGVNLRGEVGYEAMEQWWAWEDRNANGLFEAVALAQLGRWRPRVVLDAELTPEWTVQGEYRPDFSVNLPPGFSFVPHVPDQVVNASSIYREGSHLIGGQLKWVGERRGDRLGTTVLDGYVAVSLRGETGLGGWWSVWTRWDNVLNWRYQERAGYDELPLRGMIGIKGKW